MTPYMIAPVTQSLSVYFAMFPLSIASQPVAQWAFNGASCDLLEGHCHLCRMILDSRPAIWRTPLLYALCHGMEADPKQKSRRKADRRWPCASFERLLEWV